MIFAGRENDSLGILFGLGNGTYIQQRIQSTITVRLCPTIVVDINHDSRPDIIATEMHTSETHIFVFLTGEDGIVPDPIVSSSENFLYSLAIGDVDNDYELDLIGLDYDRHIHVYRGSRNGTFRNPSKYQTVAWAKSLVIGDFDNDTHLDIVIVIIDSYENDTIAVLLGYGNGSFANPILYTLSSRVISPRVADVNNDGLLDLVTVDPYKNKLLISFGDGHGSFIRQTTCSTGFYPYFVAIGDLNGDTRLDIVVANGKEPSISVFILSPMQFSTDGIPLISNQGSRLSSMIVKDFNNDHILDIVVANYGTKTIGVLLGRGDGSFHEQFTLALDASSNPLSITAGDFNNDKQLDLTVRSSASTNIDLLLGDGTGMFTRQKTYGYTLRQTASMISADDLNHDGESELIVLYENSDDIDIYAVYDTGNFTAHTIYLTSIVPLIIAVGDFNNDTLIDIVLIHSNDQMASILLSQGNGSFLHTTIPMTLQFGSQVRVYYVNDDSTPDIVLFDSSRSYIEVFLGFGNGSFVIGMNQNIDPGLMNKAAGDLNNDGYIDIVTTSERTDQLIIKLGFGNGTFAEQPRREIPCSPVFARLGDVNKDNKQDIAASNYQNQTVSVLLGYGDGSFTAPAVYGTGRYPTDSVLADLNNDNQMDIIVINTASFTFSVLLGDANLVFNYKQTLVTANGSRPRAFVTGDFNNDTHRDIAVINSGNHTLGIFLGHGNGSFSNQSVYPTDASPSLIAVGDLNNDHYLDIVIVHSDDSLVSIHLGDGTGSFPNRTTFSMDVADFDNDGLLDIIIANFLASNVIVLIGLGNGSFVSGKEMWMGYGTHPFVVGVGDFNGDQKLDFALANYARDNIEIRLQTC